jgi:hypothetical protein
MSHPLLSPTFEPATDGALDRFIVALPRTTHQGVLDFALELIDHMHSSNPPVDLRIGIHEGRFQRIQRAGANSSHLIGPGPNECTRIARIGDANHIIISEEFMRSWAKDHGSGVYQDVRPSDSDAPIEYFPKPGYPQRIYVYTPGNCNANLSNTVPSRLATFQVAEKWLEKLLPEIDETFIDLLQNEDNSLVWQTVRPRITILAPLPSDPNALVSTEFRYIQEKDEDDPDGQRSRRGPTVYWLADEGQGPAGKAFNSKPSSPVVVNSLPSFIDNHKEYIRTMEEDWNIPPENVQTFSRHARAYVVFPFGLSENDRPDGVVCIDTKSDLSTISVSRLQDIATLLMENYSLLLSALWHLRV